MGYTSQILGNARSALIAQQAAIAASSNNIANVNTPGYARRSVQLETRQGGASGLSIAVGDGVNISGLTRNADKFLEQIVQGAKSEFESSDVENQFLDRIQNLFTLSPDNQTIGSTLTGFFNSLNDLSNNPSSIELRSNLVQKTQDLVNTLKNTYNKLGSLQDEIDQRLTAEFGTVNTITERIAGLNNKIAQKEIGSGLGSAVDERDTRDTLVQQLAGKISFQSNEQSDGSLQIRLANGFTLVSGSTAKSIDFTNAASFATTAPNSISGGLLGYAVFNYGTSSLRNDYDLTQSLKAGQGTIGGLLRMRGYNDPANTSAFDAQGTLPEVAARVEAITRSLLTTVNQTYLGADRDGATAGHQPSAIDLNGTIPAVYGLFDFTYSGAKDTGATPDGLPTSSDLNTILATGAVKNFTSLLKLTSTDPRKIAAALDTSGTTTGPLAFSSGDGRNIKALASLESTNMSFSTGSYSAVTTLNDAYRQSVSYVGNLKSSAETNAAVTKNSLAAAQDKRDSFSGVNLDEEFTSLITNQTAYSAAAKMIRTAKDMFDQILQLL